MFFIRLKRLYDATELLIGKFGTSLKNDFDTTFSAIETAIVTKSWTDIRMVINDAETLFTDFLTTYTGSQAEVSTFLAALRGLFAK